MTTPDPIDGGVFERIDDSLYAECQWERAEVCICRQHMSTRHLESLDEDVRIPRAVIEALYRWRDEIVKEES